MGGEEPAFPGERGTRLGAGCAGDHPSLDGRGEIRHAREPGQLAVAGDERNPARPG